MADSSSGYWAHSSAIVDQPAQIGEGTKIWHFCHVMSGARIGARCVLGQNVFVASRVVIGSGCKIQNNVSLYDDVTLEDEVFLAPSAVFTNVINPRAFIERKHEYRKTVVGRGASVGANATIVCGHNVGAYAFVGAGAVVTKDVPPYALVIGVPARQVGWVCRCGTRLPPGLRTVCPACAASYQGSSAPDGTKTLRPQSEAQ
jgi:UDP-2-acetamido-3-amino-2,3-dideoxy-glucuronate N-acetyltransferase